MIPYDQVDFIPEINSPYKQTEKKMILSLDAEKTFDKIHHSFLERAGIQGTCLKSLKKEIEENPRKWKDLPCF